MSTTPPPPQAQPPDGPAHALAVGKAFVRQYYKILSSNPVNIRNFYHPDSSILHVGTSGGAAEGGDNKSHLFADLPDDAFAWASPIKAASDEAKDAAEESEPTDVLAIDFSAAESRIDAQNSVNGAILLVACGHMHLPGSDGSGVPDRPFIHTFVLACSAPTAPGRKKQYYVHNDVLRVMKAEKRSATAAEEATEAAATSNTKAEAKAKVAKERQAPTPAPQAAEEVPTNDGTANSKATSTTAPAQDPSPNSASAESTPKSVDKKKSRRNRGSRGNSRSSSPTNANSRDEATEEALKAAAEAAIAAVSAPKVPESWASRVKTGGPPSVPPSPARDASKKGKKQGGGKDDEATTNGGAGDGAAPSDDRGNSKDAKSSGKRPPAAPHQVSRNPDATLIVKNLPAKTTNDDIQALFDPYADRHRCPVRLVSVIQNRNIAYVDFDHPEGVTAILRDTVGHDTWELNGNVLEVKRKSDEKRSGGGGGQGGGGGNRNRHRSASPGTGHHKSGGGGGKNYRKPSPRHQRQGGGGGGGGGSRGGGGK